MTTASPDHADTEPIWREVMTTGHKLPMVRRWVCRHLPREPRCKLCSAPFAGIGGSATRLMGYTPSRKNPNICSVCIERMPPGGTEIDIAVLFADVRGSTSLGQRQSSSAFAKLMNRFYQVATKVLLEHDAVIDKLVGDEVMALFIRGFAGPDYRRRAAQAGVQLMQAMGYGGDVEPWLPLGVGVHAGLAFVGQVGSGGILDFTALGDTVNTAARLGSAAAAGEVVLGEAAFEAVAAAYPQAEQRLLTLRGKDEPLTAYVLRSSAHSPAA